MGKNRISGFFLFLVLITMIWTIYTHFFWGEVEKETTFQNEAEFINFLAQNMGMEEPHDLEELEFEDSQEKGMIETSVQPVAAKNFQLETLQQKRVQLSDFRGKKLFINFWTSWCPPCKEEMPEISAFYEQYAKQQHIEILAINITDQEFSKKDVEKFANQYQIKFPILLDETGEVSMDYQVLTIPTSFILDEEGNLLEKVSGPVTKEFLVEKFQ